MLTDYFRYGIQNLTKRKMRSWLTMLGIFIGIAAVVALVSLGQGLQKYINDEFEKMGRDMILIQPKGELGAPGTTTPVQLTKEDLDEVLKVKGIDRAAGVPVGTIEIEFNDIKRYAYALAMPVDDSKEYSVLELMFIQNYGIELGKEIEDGDARKANLGHYYLNRNLFEKNVQLGNKVTLNGEVFEVVGFYEVIGNPSDDQNIYITRDAYYELFPEKKDVYNIIYAKAALSEEPSQVADRIERVLRKSRNLEEGKEDFTIQTADSFLEAFNVILGVVQAVLIGIAAISLFVGAVGIMNTMYTAILERTKEIGVMKAIGARNNDILLLFLIESGILGFVGGGIGVLIGMGFAKLVEIIATLVLQTALLKAYFPWYLIIGALMFSFLVGAASGLLPAWQASQLKPVDALRYE